MWLVAVRKTITLEHNLSFVYFPILMKQFLHFVRAENENNDLSVYLFGWLVIVWEYHFIPLK